MSEIDKEAGSKGREIAASPFVKGNIEEMLSRKTPAPLGALLRLWLWPGCGGHDGDDVMPIRPENKARYPKDWKQISLQIRDRAGWRCEHVDDSGQRCTAAHGEPHPFTLSRVVLTVAHLDHRPENCDPDNLMAMCQRCHNAYDAPMRRAGIKERARKKMAAADLLEAQGA